MIIFLKDTLLDTIDSRLVVFFFFYNCAVILHILRLAQPYLTMKGRRASDTGKMKITIARETTNNNLLSLTYIP